MGLSSWLATTRPVPEAVAADEVEEATAVVVGTEGAMVLEDGVGTASFSSRATEVVLELVVLELVLELVLVVLVVVGGGGGGVEVEVEVGSTVWVAGSTVTHSVTQTRSRFS